MVESTNKSEESVMQCDQQESKGSDSQVQQEE